MAQRRASAKKGCQCWTRCAALLIAACCGRLLRDAWVRGGANQLDDLRLYLSPTAAGAVVDAAELRAATAQTSDSSGRVEDLGAAPAQPSCELPICGLLGSTRSPRLFFPRPEAPEGDDAAAWLAQILFGLAAASGAHARFGGLSQGNDMPDSVANRFPKLLDKLLGPGAAEHLLTNETHSFSAQIGSTQELLEKVKNLKSSANVLSTARAGKGDEALWPLFTEKLRAALRSRLDDVPLGFGDSGPVVAIYAHAESKDDSTLFATYRKPLEEIAKLWPAAKFHLWAGSARRGFWPAGAEKRDIPRLQGFKEFRIEKQQMHVHVHLESVDEEVPWAHLSRAHLLLIAADSTSSVAGILNQNCVVHPGARGLPLSNWISSHSELHVLAAAMVDCMHRVAPNFEPAERAEDVEAELATEIFHQNGWMGGGEREQQRGPSARSCNLKVCRRGAPDAPRIFVAEHGDGAGHRMKNILDGLATAEKLKINFGGVVPVGNVVTEHGHNFRDLVDGFFGAANADREFFIKPPPNFTSPKIESVRDLEAMMARRVLQKEADYFLPSANDWAYDLHTPYSKYYTPELLDALREPLSKASLGFAQGQPSVAIHVRRGDLKRDDARATPNEYYYTLVEHVKRHLPDAEVHLFSSLQSYSAEVEQGVRHWKSADFDGFRERGIHVHLDGESLLVPWLHMARADVFIMSRSSFSYVAAVVNPNCVIHAGADRPFPAWLDGNSEVHAKDKDDRKLLSCLARRSKASTARLLRDAMLEPTGPHREEQWR